MNRSQQHAYTVVRSRRKTLAIEITKDLRVLVRAPMRASGREIEQAVTHYADWIATHIEKRRQYAQAHPEPTQAEEQALREAARAHLPGRVAHFSQIMGLVPTGVKITAARTRFGSCSGKNSLCFSCFLMKYPQAAIDYVVVHELAHIVHKNHGKDFYALVERTLPDYRERRKLLKS